MTSTLSLQAVKHDGVEPQERLQHPIFKNVTYILPTTPEVVKLGTLRKPDPSSFDCTVGGRYVKLSCYTPLLAPEPYKSFNICEETVKWPRYMLKIKNRDHLSLFRAVILSAAYHARIMPRGEIVYEPGTKAFHSAFIRLDSCQSDEPIKDDWELWYRHAFKIPENLGVEHKIHPPGNHESGDPEQPLTTKLNCRNSLRLLRIMGILSNFHGTARCWIEYWR